MKFFGRNYKSTKCPILINFIKKKALKSWFRVEANLRKNYRVQLNFKVLKYDLRTLRSSRRQDIDS